MPKVEGSHVNQFQYLVFYIIGVGANLAIRGKSSTADDGVSDPTCKQSFVYLSHTGGVLKNLWIRICIDKFHSNSYLQHWASQYLLTDWKGDISPNGRAAGRQAKRFPWNPDQLIPRLETGDWLVGQGNLIWMRRAGRSWLQEDFRLVYVAVWRHWSAIDYYRGHNKRKGMNPTFQRTFFDASQN